MEISKSFWQEECLTTDWAPAHAAKCCFLFSFPFFGCCARCSEKRQALFIYVSHIYVKAGSYVSRRTMPAFQTPLVMHAGNVLPELLITE